MYISSINAAFPSGKYLQFQRSQQEEADALQGVHGEILSAYI